MYSECGPLPLLTGLSVATASYVGYNVGAVFFGTIEGRIGVAAFSATLAGVSAVAGQNIGINMVRNRHHSD